MQCLFIKRATGSYPSNFFMYLRVEIFREHLNSFISFMEYLYMGTMKKLFKKSI